MIKTIDFSHLTHYNLHSHTPYCDGRAPMETMARAAVAAGMTLYGFTPHSPVPIISPCNMRFEDVDSYLAEYRRIAAMPELASCRFLAGMEADYLGSEWGPANDYFRSLPLDYIIGSIHFIPTRDGGQYVDIDGSFDSFDQRLKYYFGGDIEYVVETFFARSHMMLDEGGFDILGHFDKIGLNASHAAPGIEDSDFYRRIADGLVDHIVSSGVAVELNTKAYARHHRFFPSERLSGKLAEAGTVIIVNSDAHYPGLVDAGRAEGLALLHSYERSS